MCVVTVIWILFRFFHTASTFSSLEGYRYTQPQTSRPPVATQPNWGVHRRDTSLSVSGWQPVVALVVARHTQRQHNSKFLRVKTQVFGQVSVGAGRARTSESYGRGCSRDTGAGISLAEISDLASQCETPTAIVPSTAESVTPKAAP